MRLVFSKDRAAQLDLLLRSLDRYAPAEPTQVIVRSLTRDFSRSYDFIQVDHPDVAWRVESGAEGFRFHLSLALLDAGETVTFFCDDDILYKPVDLEPSVTLARLPEVLTFSLRLGSPTLTWDWTQLPPHDHGYPGSIDGHTFRTEDLRWMLKGQEIPNPLILETVLARRVGRLGKPLMASYREQKLVGVNVNNVSGDQTRVGGRYPQTAEMLNARYLAGQRISLDKLKFPPAGGCLVEVPFEWENR